MVETVLAKYRLINEIKKVRAKHSQQILQYKRINVLLGGYISNEFKVFKLVRIISSSTLVQLLTALGTKIAFG